MEVEFRNEGLPGRRVDQERRERRLQVHMDRARGAERDGVHLHGVPSVAKGGSELSMLLLLGQEFDFVVSVGAVSYFHYNDGILLGSYRLVLGPQAREDQDVRAHFSPGFLSDGRGFQVGRERFALDCGGKVCEAASVHDHVGASQPSFRDATLDAFDCRIMPLDVSRLHVSVLAAG